MFIPCVLKLRDRAIVNFVSMKSGIALHQFPLCLVQKTRAIPLTNQMQN